MAACSRREQQIGNRFNAEVKIQSDEDSGVEFGHQSLRTTIRLNSKKKCHHLKKRCHPALRKSLCSDSGISDHERPASCDSSSRLVPSSPDDCCLDLSLKDAEQCHQSTKPDDDDFCRDAVGQRLALSPIKREKLDSDGNLIRQRRVEANARERTRVHTIGAAFDSLRKSIPAYSDGQKLSKLAILRVASSYIVALSSLLEDRKQGLAQGVQGCSAAIHLDGKVRRR